MLSSPDNVFEKTLRQKVKDYFAYNQLTPKGGHTVTCKIVLVLLGLLLAYIGMIFLGNKTPILLIVFLLALLFFQVTAALGVMHDASHNALTNNRHLNKFISYLIMASGGMSARVWKQKHVFAHHSHPNTSNKDTDIEGQPLFRFSPFQKRYWFHSKQHYYALFFYTLLTIKWVLFDDVRDVIMNVYQLNLKKRLLCSIDIILTRIIYLTLSLLVPFIVFHLFWITLGIWLFYNMSFSLCLTLVFQCSHVNTKTCFYPNKVEAPNNFAIRQLDTTVDYGINNPFLTWIVGGLNFQVIHHLFPTVNHRHFPAIQRLLVKCLEQHPEIAYHHFPSFRAAIKDHLLFLKQVARPQPI